MSLLDLPCLFQFIKCKSNFLETRQKLFYQTSYYNRSLVIHVYQSFTISLLRVTYRRIDGRLVGGVDGSDLLIT